MKEYKVVNPSLGFRNRSVKLEEAINKFAKDGWTLNCINNNRNGGISYLVFEREKFR